MLRCKSFLSTRVPDDKIIEDGEVYKERLGTIQKRTIIIFTIAFVATLMLLYICDGIRREVVHQRMLQYNITTARNDGTPNRVVMNGKAGALGYSYVKLQYLEDGWIRLVGENNEDSNGWKLISVFTLEPGTYTLTGMKGQNENKIALQLRIEDDTGYYCYLYQYDEDVQFTIERETTATLHARVYPKVEKIDVKARPAVYRDE